MRQLSRAVYLCLLVFAPVSVASAQPQAVVSVGPSQFVNPSGASSLYNIGLSAQGRGELNFGDQIKPTILVGVSRRTALGIERYEFDFRGGFQARGSILMGGADIGMQSSQFMSAADAQHRILTGLHGGVQFSRFQLTVQLTSTVEGVPEIGIGAQVGVIVNK